jgi:Ca-activated chloride channel family protein
MVNRKSLRAFFLLFFYYTTAASQVISTPSSSVGNLKGLPGGLGLTSPEEFTNDLWAISSLHSPLEDLGGSTSKLDLKAPGKARREFEKGYQLLMRKNHQGAAEHLTIATAIYPSFVSAHNALGKAYLGLGQNERAHAEFSQAVSLDDHLPNSFLILGCAELALQHFSAAEGSIQKASALAPLDLTLLTALVYGQLMNHDYSAAINTAHQVHERAHKGAAMVHFYAAAALGAQGNLAMAQEELRTFLREDPKSLAAVSALQTMQQLDEGTKHPSTQIFPASISFSLAQSEPHANPEQLSVNVRIMQASNENKQITDAEEGAECLTCGTAELSRSVPPETSSGVTPSTKLLSSNNDYVLHTSTDEVPVFFSVTDHGKSITTLTVNDIEILDDQKAPAGITGFRTESELPLRLGIVIDTSSSVASTFKFEQNSASSFLKNVVTSQSDLAFVIGVTNSILLAQDFTGDQKLLSHAVSELVPSGGTALWDAVNFGADKLARLSESKPVSRILVVISDGEDNSSSVTLWQAIDRAQRGEVTVCTVSTHELTNPNAASLVGEHALSTLAELTGGAAFSPGSVGGLKRSLNDLQQVIRSRYVVSYKPASFKRDGHYHTIDITAGKDGHKLHVYAREGYFASAASPTGEHD